MESKSKRQKQFVLRHLQKQLLRSQSEGLQQKINQARYLQFLRLTEKITGVLYRLSHLKFRSRSYKARFPAIRAYKFENMQLTEQGSQTVLLADVTNTSSSATDLQLVDVTLLDKEGKEIITVGGIISPLQPGAKTQFNTSMTLDYANTYDFKIELKK